MTLVLLVMFGCGSGGDIHKPDASILVPDDAEPDAQAPGDFSLSVAPMSLTVPLAGSADVAVTISRTPDGAPVAVELSARDLPAGVTVTFTPAKASAEVDLSIATIHVATSAAIAMTQITIVGTAGAVEHTAPLTITTSTITVTGSVSPATAGITVRVVGKASTTTAAGGTFSFTDVTPPYDLYTVSTDLFGGKVIYYYQGLTRPDPIVLINPPLIFGTVSSGTVSGSLSGGLANFSNVVAWSDSGQQSFENISANPSYSFTASWPTATTRQGTLHALAWYPKNSTGVTPPTWFLYGSTNATLTANTTNNVNVALSTPPHALVTGKLVPPAGYPTPTVFMTQQLGTSNGAAFYATTPAGGDVSLRIPRIPSAGTCTLYASSSSGGGSSSYTRPGIGESTNVSFTLPDPATLMTPANAATGVNTSTNFTFSSSPGTVYSLNMYSSAFGVGSYNVFTTSTTARIPNVTEAPLPAGQTFNWSVAGFAPHNSVDDIATPTGAEYTTTADFTGPAHTYTYSAGRSFTSQ